MAALLQRNIRRLGMIQGDAVRFMENVRDIVNELQEDHATSRTLTEELIADHATFKDVVDELKLDYTALLADVTAIRAEVVKLVTDMGTRISNHNTLITKLNADAGVTDTNYAAAGAITAGNPAAITGTAIATSAPATLSSTSPASLTNSTALTLDKP